MWVLGAHDGASTKHHLVLCEGAGLVWEDVFNLPQVLRDVQGLTLHSAVCILVVQINVISDEEDLTNLYQLDGHVEGDGNQDLKWGEKKCKQREERQERARKKGKKRWWWTRGGGKGEDVEEWGDRRGDKSLMILRL